MNGSSGGATGRTSGPAPAAADGGEIASGTSAGLALVGVLLVTERGRSERELRIRAERIRVGRDPTSEVALEDDTVSRAHAEIVRRGEAFFLSDAGSSNGTFINNRRIPTRVAIPLNDGDRVLVGRSVLRFLVRLSARWSSRRMASGRRVKTAPASRRGGGGDDLEKPISLFRLKNEEGSLVVSGAGRPPLRLPLESDRVRIGRDPGCDIVLDDPSVSKDHAEIVYTSDGFHVVDRESSVGTFLDGVAVRVAHLGNRAYLRFGKQKVLFVVHTAGEGPPEASFHERDRLAAVFPERRTAIQETFRSCREEARDFAEELVLRGILDPEEWWSATSGQASTRKPGKTPLARLLARWRRR